MAPASVQSGHTHHEEARTQWASVNGNLVEKRKVKKGEPSWLQSDETLLAIHVATQRNLSRNWNKGPDWQTEMNFGGGGCTPMYSAARANRNTAKLVAVLKVSNIALKSRTSGSLGSCCKRRAIEFNYGAGLKTQARHAWFLAFIIFSFPIRFIIHGSLLCEKVQRLRYFANRPR